MERYIHTYRERETETERQRGTERDTEKESLTERERQKHAERECERQLVACLARFPHTIHIKFIQTNLSQKQKVTCWARLERACHQTQPTVSINVPCASSHVPANPKLNL